MDDSKLLEEIEGLIDKKFREHLSGEEIVDASSAENILEKYDTDVEIQFRKELKEQGRLGLDKRDIMRIFNVGKSQAYNIQQKLAAQYRFIEYHKRGGKAALTRHKKHAYAEDLARGMSESKKEIIHSMENSVSDDESVLEILEEKWEELQTKRKNKKRRGFQNL